MSVTSLGATSHDQPSDEPPEAAVPTGDTTSGALDLHVVPDAAVPDRRRTSVLPLLVGVLAALTLAGAGLLAGAGAFTWLCAVSWATVAGLQASARRRPAAVLARMRTDLRAGLLLGSVVALAAVAGLESMADARWGIAVVAAGAVGTVLTRGVQPRRSVTRRVVLVGDQHDVEAYTSSVRGGDVVLAGCCIVGAGPALAVHPTAALPTTTGLDTLDELVCAVRADVVLVLPGRATDPDVVRRLTWTLEHTKVSVGVLTPVSSVAAHRLSAVDLDGRTVLELAPVGASVLETRAKEVIDRLGAAAVILLVSPVLLLLWVSVRLDSKGPGLFVQTRVGKDGKLFRMVKLRTMFTDAESMKKALLEDNESDGVLFKIRRDPRVTRVGYWLRRSSLDELPQLFNVLRGEMSLVGPRPALPSEVASYHDTARRRMVVKPGITGLWQVSGRSDLMWDESLSLDLYYTDNWRIVDDFVIAVRTVAAVATARGAY